jgi:hypothetical protein
MRVLFLYVHHIKSLRILFNIHHALNDCLIDMGLS